MALSYEANTSLAFDTTDLRQQASKYREIATRLRTMSKELDDCLTELKNSGWTTPAGTAFQEMVDTNWEQNIEKYAALLDTLDKALVNAANRYDTLTHDHIEQTCLRAEGGGGFR